MFSSFMILLRYSCIVTCRFDSELYALQADVTDLKMGKEKLQREKDKLGIEKNQFERDVEVSWRQFV